MSKEGNHFENGWGLGSFISGLKSFVFISLDEVAYDWRRLEEQLEANNRYITDPRGKVRKWLVDECITIRDSAYRKWKHIFNTLKELHTDEGLSSGMQMLWKKLRDVIECPKSDEARRKYLDIYIREMRKERENTEIRYKVRKTIKTE